ncbi:MAG: L-tyrosine/L-tryptophan isonitrile synthase family protein, partial [Bdellovibrionota bacterium]
ISRLIEELGLAHLISTFNLEDLFGSLSFTEMREQLMTRHGQPLSALQEKVRRGGKPGSDRESDDAQRMYCGITRFLVEDAARPDQTISKTAIQKDCKARAYEVIRRSNAWSGLVESQFSDAVRLSIHPQACGAAKLGIGLMEGESWMTPWHGVAVKVGERFFLMKRFQAEALGATVVQSRGRASHYELAEGRSVPA